MLSVNGTHGDHCPHIVKFPDISGFPRKVVTLRTRHVLITCSKDEFCYYLVTYTFICSAHIVCGVGSVQLLGIRPSIWATAAGLLLWALLPGDIDRGTVGGQQQQRLSKCRECHVVSLRC